MTKKSVFGRALAALALVVFAGAALAQPRPARRGLGARMMEKKPGDDWTM